MNGGKGIAGHGNGAPPVQQVQVSRKVIFMGPTVNVVQHDDGGRTLQIIHADSGTLYEVVLDGKMARQLGGALMSAVPVVGADEMPRGGG